MVEGYSEAVYLVVVTVRVEDMKLALDGGRGSWTEKLAESDRRPCCSRRWSR